MQNESINGKAVSPHPSFWNKTTAIGFGIGSWVGACIITLVITATPAAPLTPLILLAIASSLTGGIIGGLQGEQRLKNEYLEAKQWVNKHGYINQNQENHFRFQPVSLAQGTMLSSSKNTFSNYEIPNDMWNQVEKKITERHQTAKAQNKSDKRNAPDPKNISIYH
jgi:hypothetical protein